jgi:hypothetical protein
MECVSENRTDSRIFLTNLKVIGDKDGSRAVRDLALNPYIKNVFPQMKEAVKVPFKYIHVLRNPFDIVATMILQHISRDPLSSKERKKFFLNPVSKNYLGTVVLKKYGLGPHRPNAIR